MRIYPFTQLGHARYAWLDARYHFSFASYHHPQRMGFGKLRVINDDTIQPGKGFASHTHRDMEIITYVRQGAITHHDNKGNHGRIAAGNLQVMRAGSGIEHSEYNLEETITQLYQIWIEPSQKNTEPSWHSHGFPQIPVTKQLNLLASGDGKAPLYIQQQAWIYGGVLLAGCHLQHPIQQQAYLLVSEGSIVLQGQKMTKGDGAEICKQSAISITAKEQSELLLIDVPE